jgi:hypothetical protein
LISNHNVAMSAAATSNDSPNTTPIQPLHNPSQAAHVVVPQAPLGNVINQPAGMGAKALLAKKMAKDMSVSHTTRLPCPQLMPPFSNPSFVSPTDKLMTPCSQKLSAVKKKHFTKYASAIYHGFVINALTSLQGRKTRSAFCSKGRTVTGSWRNGRR